MSRDIKAIFIDLGDTFRIIRKDKAYSDAAKTRIGELLGVEGDPVQFFDNVIEPRYSVYREWALKFCCEAPERVLWTRWLAYDFPKERVEQAAGELTYEYRRSKGERVVTGGGVETIMELYRRGYILGIISDLVGVKEVDEWLEHDRLKPYFKTVQQSSHTLLRKPHPAIYYYALQETGAVAEQSCYVGDNLNRDIVGAKAAGFGMTIGVQYPGKKFPPITEENRPDQVITHFSQLLELFPPLT